MIPSPYNFVPLSEKIFFPDWSKYVSMDVPFADGISGTLAIRVIAKTDIYIRNGGTHPEEQEGRLKSTEYRDFFRVHPQGPYAIPGSSMKGMIRNVLEIASFGKIVGSKSSPRVTDHRYAIRDLHNSSLYGNHITEKTPRGYRPKVQGAWLQINDQGEWELTLCEFARVEQRDLESYFKLNPGALRLRKPAKSKYESIGINNLEIKFDCDSQEKEYPHSCGNLVYKKAKNLGTGSRTGTIVFTGQPSERKHMEFIFYDESQEKIPVPEHVRRDFEFAHSELGENRKPNQEWGFWKPRLYMGEKVPVFVLMEKGQLHSMGLAMMYRFPYKYSIHEAVAHTSPEHLNGENMDLAETLFGRVEDRDALRGRVCFETLLAEGNPKTGNRDVKTVLGGPKPTYYPNYIEQPKRGNPYKTFMNNDARIRGWKRYAVRSMVSEVSEVPKDKSGRQNLKVATVFCPLPAGTSFYGFVHLHNVRPVELGALLWAMTWGENPNCWHNIGMAKPFGYGAVTVEIDFEKCSLRQAINGEDIPCRKETCNGFSNLFVAMMKGFDANWASSPQLKTLLFMANPNSKYPYELRYPTLSPNEFVEHKKAQHVLVSPTSPPAQSVAPSQKAPYKKGGFQKTSHRQSASPRQGGIPAAGQHAGLQVNQEVDAVLLDEKTKKGNWKAKVNDVIGAITNSNEIKDCKPGDIIRAKITSIGKDILNLLFVSRK